MSTNPFRADWVDGETLRLGRAGMHTPLLAALRMGVETHPWSAAFCRVAITANNLQISDVRLQIQISNVPLCIVGGAVCPRSRIGKFAAPCASDTCYLCHGRSRSDAAIGAAPDCPRARVLRINFPCAPEECQVCNVRFFLDTALENDRPANKRGWVPVYARDLLTESRSVMVAHPDLLLFYRRPGQHVALAADTRCAPAYVHARHMHAVAGAMRVTHRVIVHDAVARPIADRLRAGCSEGVFDLEDIGADRGGPYMQLTAARPENCIGCGRCTRPIGGRVPVTVEPVAHELTLESSITPPQLLLAETATALLRLLREVRDALVLADICQA